MENLCYFLETNLADITSKAELPEVKENAAKMKTKIEEVKKNAGLVESDKNYIIFFGGKNENGNALSSALKYDLNRNKFEESQFSLNEGASFQQGVMPKIKDDTFGNFCLEAGMSFIKINFS